MHSPGPLPLLDTLETNQEVIHVELKDITHAESLVLPAFNANSLNWVLGHILTSRDECLSLLDLPGVLTPDETAMYRYGSERLTDPANALDFAVMLEKLDASFAVLQGRLKTIPPADLEKEVNLWGRPEPLGGMLAFFFWHEAYHTGQLNLLRQVAGKNDKTI